MLHVKRAKDQCLAGAAALWRVCPGQHRRLSPGTAFVLVGLRTSAGSLQTSAGSPPPEQLANGRPAMDHPPPAEVFSNVS